MPGHDSGLLSNPQQLHIAASALRAVKDTDPAEPGDQQAALQQIPMILAGLQRALRSAERAPRPASPASSDADRLAAAEQQLRLVLADALHAAEAARAACADLATRNEYVLTRELAIARAGVGEAAYEIRLHNDPQHGPHSEYTYDVGAAHYLAIRRAEHHPPAMRVEIWRLAETPDRPADGPEATINGLFDPSSAV